MFIINATLYLQGNLIGRVKSNRKVVHNSQLTTKAPWQESICWVPLNVLIFLSCEDWGLEDVDYPNFIPEPVKSSKCELSFVQGSCLSPEICICFVVRSYRIHSFRTQNYIRNRDKKLGIYDIIPTFCNYKMWSSSLQVDLQPVIHLHVHMRLVVKHFSKADSFPKDTFAINVGLKIVCFFLL